MARLVLRERGSGDAGLPAGAVLGSLGLHALLLAVLVWGAARIAIPAPARVYQVQLLAAPRPEPVRQAPAQPRRPEPREPEPEPRESRPAETKPAVVEQAEPVPESAAEKEERAEPTPEPQTEPERRPAAPPEQSEDGVDDAPVRLEGAPFSHPEYLANIIRQIKRHWRPPSGAQQLRAELAFTILRDGSVEDLTWIRRSGNPAFDLEARGAIEAAGRRRAFGALPRDYPGDRLRVSFFFDPTRY